MPIRQVEQTFILTAIMPAAGTPVGSVMSINFQPNLQIASVPQESVPAAESWLLEDFYVSAAQTYDGLVTFYRNYLQVAWMSGNINGLVVTNTARPIPTPFTFQGNDIITATFSNIAIVPTSASAVTITMYAKFRRFTPY